MHLQSRFQDFQKQVNFLSAWKSQAFHCLIENILKIFPATSSHILLFFPNIQKYLPPQQIKSSPTSPQTEDPRWYPPLPPPHVTKIPFLPPPPLKICWWTTIWKTFSYLVAVPTHMHTHQQHYHNWTVIWAQLTGQLPSTHYMNNSKQIDRVTKNQIHRITGKSMWSMTESIQE